MATMRWTYRKVLNRGFTPCWYKTDHGSRIAWVEKDGKQVDVCPLCFRQLRKRLPLSEQRYMTPLKSKRG